MVLQTGTSSVSLSLSWSGHRDFVSQSEKPFGTLKEMNGSSSEKADIDDEMKDDQKADHAKLMAAWFVTKRSVSEISSGKNSLR